MLLRISLEIRLLQASQKYSLSVSGLEKSIILASASRYYLWEAKSQHVQQLKLLTRGDSALQGSLVEDGITVLT